ncbi:MAG: DUF2520 domain-containing protein [Niabella sp.]
MNIVIIGSGNVAAVLGRKFVAADHTIVQVLSRNAAAASQLAYEWNTESANYTSLINKNADVYIIAVADIAIKSVVDDLQLQHKVVAHTAGAVNIDILKKVTDDYGVFYPLQSLRKEQERLPEIPVYIEAASEKAEKVLSELARSVYPVNALTANFDKRTKLHVAAVLVNNFTNHIFYLTEQYCKREGIDFEALLPLIENTFYRLREASPSVMQTGPAARGDMDTIEKHIAILENDPPLLNLYKFLTESIIGHSIEKKHG